MSAAESSMHKYFNPKCLRAACLFTNPLLLLAHYITMSNCSQLMFPIVTLWSLSQQRDDVQEERECGGRSEEMMRKQEELSQNVRGWLEFWFGMYSPHWLHSEGTLTLCPSISAETTLEVFLLPVLCSLDELKAVFGEDDMDL